MRITKIADQAWPLMMHCPTDKMDIEVSLPTDMQRVIEYDYQTIDGIPIPQQKRTYFTVKCPCCEACYEIEESRVPKAIAGKVSLDPSCVPYIHHE